MGSAALAEGAAIAATVVAVVGAWPQVRRTLTSGDARGVSVTTPSLGVATELAWVVYAVHEGLWSALPEAVLMVAANVVLAVVLWRAGSAMWVAALAALGWMAVLGTTAALGGPAAIAALLDSHRVADLRAPPHRTPRSDSDDLVALSATKSPKNR